MIPKVSIIIPCKEIDEYAKQCVKRCQQLDYENFEIILLPDALQKNSQFDGAKVIATSAVPPGAKRNIGIENTTGEILAFLDSDAYPRKDWLKNAVAYLENQEIAAVGGPGITPEEDGDMQKASGYILSSFLMGDLAGRYASKNAFESDDIHSCNFIVKRSALANTRWSDKYWPGEDTLLSLELKKNGARMLEAPDVVIYHHRRPLFLGHLKQVSNFGIHRGFFAKKFPQTSLRPVYLLPALFVLCLLGGGVAAYMFPVLRTPFLLVIVLYLLLSLLSALPSKKLVPFVFIGIIATHIAYGIFFLFGLIEEDLER